MLVAFVFCNAVLTEALDEDKTERVSVSIHDGIRLATDVYRIVAAQPGLVVLVRTPYDPTKKKAISERLGKAGYVFPTQDCRGMRASEGVLAQYSNKGQNG